MGPGCIRDRSKARARDKRMAMSPLATALGCYGNQYKNDSNPTSENLGSIALITAELGVITGGRLSYDPWG
jgi:hypothetical protein